MRRLSAALETVIAALAIAGCSSSDGATVSEDTQDIASAFVTCTPVDAAKASFGGAIAWDKLWIRKNAKGQPSLTFRIERGGAPAKNEVWQSYEDSPVNETTKTATAIHVVLGEDVTYTLDAHRADASAPYLGRLETTEDEAFDVSCR